VPVLVVVLPPIFLLGAGIISSARVGIFAGLAITGVAAVFGQLGRDRGKRLEPGLWESWGGTPTLQQLRYRGTTDTAAVGRLHSRIEQVLGDPLPSDQEEQDDAPAADARYTEATRRLIALTTDHARFPLVFAENINYGMRRNLLGLRPIGIAVCLATVLAAALLLGLAGGHLPQRAARYAPGLGVALIELLFWIAVVSRNWVRMPAEAYASRLMESIEVLLRETRSET
jgi:hypothetical protein